MMQLSEAARPIDLTASRLGYLADQGLAREDTASAAECGATGEPDEPPVFVSPPPVPWPRVFPSL